jgi:hypothetical protein
MLPGAALVRPAGWTGKRPAPAALHHREGQFRFAAVAGDEIRRDQPVHAIMITGSTAS